MIKILTETKEKNNVRCHELGLLSDALIKGLYVQQHFHRKRSSPQICKSNVGCENFLQLCHGKPTAKIHASEDIEVQGGIVGPTIFSVDMCAPSVFHHLPKTKLKNSKLFLNVPQVSIIYDAANYRCQQTSDYSPKAPGTGNLVWTLFWTQLIIGSGSSWDHTEQCVAK